MKTWEIPLSDNVLDECCGQLWFTYVCDWWIMWHVMDVYYVWNLVNMKLIILYICMWLMDNAHVVALSSWSSHLLYMCFQQAIEAVSIDSAVVFSLVPGVWGCKHVVLTQTPGPTRHRGVLPQSPCRHRWSLSSKIVVPQTRIGSGRGVYCLIWQKAGAAHEVCVGRTRSTGWITFLSLCALFYFAKSFPEKCYSIDHIESCDTCMEH